jgi:multidrug efflux pump subunit AcrA (membrane-fusion protein)
VLDTWDVAAKKADLFVVNGEVAKRRTVQTGVLMEDTVEITSGLTPSEQVIIRGGFNLRDGDRVTVILSNGG